MVALLNPQVPAEDQKMTRPCGPIAAEVGIIALEIILLASRVPQIMRYLTPSKSLTLPPLTSTTECSCKLWPIPGI
jgi:hypothetical protein